jgi:hypothetical protein
MNRQSNFPTILDQCYSQKSNHLPICSQTVVSPVVPAEVQQMVSRRARQFESGRVEEDRTVLYRSELARMSAKKVVPDVVHRKQEFESKSRSLDAAGESLIEVL